MTERAVAVQHIAYAALDALRAVMPLDLCAYLHVGEGDGPQLYLRAPELASMTAAEAFAVFTSLRDAVGSVESDEPTPCAIGRYEAVAVRSRGPRSSGVFVVGREDEPLTEAEQSTVSGICRAMGAACHFVEEQGAAPGAPTVQRVAVSARDGVVTAEVVAGAGRTGRADGATTSDAVALATIEALAPDHKLVGVSDADVGGERIVLVLVRDGDDQSVLGAELAPGDALMAVASATAAALTDR